MNWLNRLLHRGQMEEMLSKELRFHLDRHVADLVQLVAVHGHTAQWNSAIYGEQNVAYLDFLDFQRQSRCLDAAGWLYNAGTLNQPGEPSYVVHLEVSSNLFEVLGVSLLRGRTFLP